MKKKNYSQYNKKLYKINKKIFLYLITIFLFTLLLITKNGFSANCQTSTCSSNIEIVLILDDSRSMHGSVGNLKSGARSFVNDMMNYNTNQIFTRIGIVKYHSTAKIEHPLDTNADALYNAIDSLKADGSATAIGYGIQKGIVALEDSRPNIPRYMIVMTDGIQNRGIDPEIVANEAKNKGILIITIAYGSDAEEDRLRRIQNAGFYKGNNMNTIFKDIATDLCPCGDGILDQGEDCDWNKGGTITDCTPQYNGVCEYCNCQCRNEAKVGGFCGDNIKQSGYEGCDDGLFNGLILKENCDGNQCTYCDNNCQLKTVDYFSESCGNKNRDEVEYIQNNFKYYTCQDTISNKQFSFREDLKPDWWNNKPSNIV
jgi:uncharacterized protein YegL